jgi:hypothetical protein
MRNPTISCIRSTWAGRKPLHGRQILIFEAAFVHQFINSKGYEERVKEKRKEKKGQTAFNDDQLAG